MSETPKKETPFNPFAEGSPASETEKNDNFEPEVKAKAERPPENKKPDAEASDDDKPKISFKEEDSKASEKTAEVPKPSAEAPKPSAEVPKPPAKPATPKPAASPPPRPAFRAPAAAARTEEKPATTAPKPATTAPKLGGASDRKPKAQAAPIVRPSGSRSVGATSSPQKKAPSPAQMSSDDSPSLLGVITDAVAAAVAIAFTVLIAMELAPFL